MGYKCENRILLVIGTSIFQARPSELLLPETKIIPFNLQHLFNSN